MGTQHVHHHYLHKQTIDAQNATPLTALSFLLLRPFLGDPDTLTNFGINGQNVPPQIGGDRNGIKPYNRKTNIKPVVEYEYDRDQPIDRESQSPSDDDAEEPCEEFKPEKKKDSTFNRNLYNLWRTYGVASALLNASNRQKEKEEQKNKKGNDENTDRIQLIHPPSEDDKKLKPAKGKSSGRKYNYYYDHDHDHFHYHHDDEGKTNDNHSYRRNLD